MPTLIEESGGMTYWFIKNISAMPMAARIKKLTTADINFFPKSDPSFHGLRISLNEWSGNIFCYSLFLFPAFYSPGPSHSLAAFPASSRE